MIRQARRNTIADPNATSTLGTYANGINDTGRVVGLFYANGISLFAPVEPE